MFYNNVPELDIHGQDRITAKILTDEFISDNHKLRYYKVVIIHGVGMGILKEAVHNTLKKHPFVDEYKLDIFNIGTTLIDIKKT